jgi:hypothetical protein
MPRLLWVAAALVLCFAGQASAAALRLYVEAEDCDGLQRYPYDNEAAAGWYARESSCRAYGAPGRSYHAAIHETSAPDRRTMTQALPAPLPPGKYQVFLRVVGPSGADRDTVVRVALGEAVAGFTWNKGPKRFAWLPGVAVELARPATSVSFTAVQFGGNGHGALYETLARSIWVDTLYVTDDLDDKTPPPIEAERALRGGVDPAGIPPRPAYAVDRYDTPLPTAAVEAKPIRLESFDGRRNLWPNSSFELGMNDGWAAANAGVRVFTDEDLDADRPFHGRYALRAPGGANPFCRPYHLTGAGRVTLSLYVRGEGAPVEVQLLRVVAKDEAGYDHTRPNTKPVLRIRDRAEAEWRRLSVAGDAPEGTLYLYVRSDRTVWLDAVQLERGDLTDYAPRAAMEGALRTGQLGNVVYDDQATLDAWFHNSGAAAAEGRLAYRVVDVREAVVAEGETPPVAVPASATVRQPVKVLPALRGVFSVSCGVAGRGLPESETVYLKMPAPPAVPTRHMLGANIDLNPVTLRLKRRMGLKWALTCKTRILGAASEGAHTKPDEWRFYDEDAAAPAKADVGLIPALWPHRVPAFMLQTDPKPSRVTRGGRPTPLLKLDLWTEHVRQVVGHYRDTVKFWCVDDETECSWSAEPLAELIGATTDAARKVAPDVKIGVSATPEFTEEVLRHVDVSKLDFFGGSTFDFHHWTGARVRRLCERYDRKWVCYGVGSRPPENTMYHTSYWYSPVLHKASRMACRTVNMLLVQDLWIAGHYAGILRNDGVHMGFNKPLADYDGTPLPWGGTFACLGTLLADARLIADAPLGDAGRMAYIFRTGDRLAAVTWSTLMRDGGSYHLWKPSPRRYPGVAFACPEDGVEALDMYWNPLPAAAWRDGRLRLDVGEEPVFLLNRALSEEQFRAMLTKAEVPKPAVGIGLALTPPEGGAAQLCVTVTNNGVAPLRDARIDLRSQENAPVSIAGAWLTPRPVLDVGTVPAGESRTVKTPTVLDGRAPYEDGLLRAVLTAADGVEHAVEDWLWLVPAARRQGQTAVDGDLAEWTGRPAAWLSYDWSWARFGRESIQIADGGEFFSYPSFTLDARAAFWTGWDANNLYVAVRLEDDQPIVSGEVRERVRIALAANGRATSLTVTPGPDGRCEAQLDTPAATAPVTAASRLGPQAVCIEAAIPWAALGVSPAPNLMLGFDLYWSDADREGKDLVSGTLRWAGGASRLGSLLLTEAR